MELINLLLAEMRRALHRRVVWALVALAAVGIVILGLIAFFDSAGKSVAELGENGSHPALLADWWIAGGGDGILLVGAIPLLIGGRLGGAAVVGGEWRAGTVTTVLTWEPRRVRLHGARIASTFLLAALIAFVLQAILFAAALPAVLTHGTSAGVDAAWWLSLVGAMARIALVTGAAAMLGASLATLGRGTTFALGAAFGWMAIVENLIRGAKPSLQPLLVGDNLAIVVTWAPLDEITRSAPLAAATVATYFGVVALAAATAFVRRDVVAVA